MFGCNPSDSPTPTCAPSPPTSAASPRTQVTAGHMTTTPTQNPWAHRQNRTHPPLPRHRRRPAHRRVPVPRPRPATHRTGRRRRPIHEPTAARRLHRLPKGDRQPCERNRTRRITTRTRPTDQELTQNSASADRSLLGHSCGLPALERWPDTQLNICGVLSQLSA